VKNKLKILSSTDTSSPVSFLQAPLSAKIKTLLYHLSMVCPLQTHAPYHGLCHGIKALARCQCYALALPASRRAYAFRGIQLEQQKWTETIAQSLSDFRNRSSKNQKQKCNSAAAVVRARQDSGKVLPPNQAPLELKSVKKESGSSTQPDDCRHQEIEQKFHLSLNSDGEEWRELIYRTYTAT
jgi:hypothetical protein